MAKYTMTDTKDDDLFQVHTNNKINGQPKRVYIGGLPKNVPTLQEDLSRWMKEQVPELSIKEIKILSRTKAPHALVDCGTQAGLVISKLHQKSFNGRRLTVQREKRSNNKINQSKFGGWSKPKNQFSPIPVDEATENIHSVVSGEIKQAEENGKDLINVALASTAAASLFASMNAISDPQAPEEETGKQNTVDAGFQMKDMSAMLADFGQADPNWKKQHVIVESQQQEGTSRLAPKGKAPIHIILSSFGFLHGAPKRPEGWSHSQPLAFMDCRELFESVPNHLQWQIGLSGVVKRVLRQVNPEIQQYARTTVADQVWDCLLDAQKAGYGYASPLEMTIYIGSESGKHRSVVLCEWAATAIRKKLRANEKDCIQQPVSVATYNRDAERHKVERKKNREDGKSQKKNNEFAGDW